MISYRPVPALTLGRSGFRSAVASMVLAAVIGTATFGAVEAVLPSQDMTSSAGTEAATKQQTGEV